MELNSFPANWLWLLHIQLPAISHCEPILARAQHAGPSGPWLAPCHLSVPRERSAGMVSGVLRDAGLMLPCSFGTRGVETGSSLDH